MEDFFYKYPEMAKFSWKDIKNKVHNKALKAKRIIAKARKEFERVRKTQGHMVRISGPSFFNILLCLHVFHPLTECSICYTEHRTSLMTQKKQTTICNLKFHVNERSSGNSTQASKTEIFARRARLDQALGLCYRIKT